MAQSFSVSDFKARLQYGGARPTLFSVQLTLPPQLGINQDFSNAPFLIRTANLPESDLGMIQVPYFGRNIKIAGDRTFAPWTVTVINDEDFLIRNGLEAWSNAINQMRGNQRLGSAANLSYKAQATVTQYSKTGDSLRTYVFEGMFPRTISAIDLNWGQQDTIEEYTVQLEYDNWTVQTGGVTGDPGDQG